MTPQEMNTVMQLLSSAVRLAYKTGYEDKAAGADYNRTIHEFGVIEAMHINTLVERASRRRTHGR